jgi:hypothetical protein
MTPDRADFGAVRSWNRRRRATTLQTERLGVDLRQNA